MKLEIKKQSAYVRVLVEIKSVIFSSFRPLAVSEVKNVQFFPLAFTFSEEYNRLHTRFVKKELSSQEGCRKLLNELPVLEPGWYEIVGHYTSEYSTDQHDNYVQSLWTFTEPKAYQLSAEEVSRLPEYLKSCA